MIHGEGDRAPCLLDGGVDAGFRRRLSLAAIHAGCPLMVTRLLHVGFNQFRSGTPTHVVNRRRVSENPTH